MPFQTLKKELYWSQKEHLPLMKLPIPQNHLASFPCALTTVGGLLWNLVYELLTRGLIIFCQMMDYSNIGKNAVSSASLVFGSFFETPKDIVIPLFLQVLFSFMCILDWLVLLLYQQHCIII